MKTPKAIHLVWIIVLLVSAAAACRLMPSRSNGAIVADPTPLPPQKPDQTRTIPTEEPLRAAPTLTTEQITEEEEEDTDQQNDRTVSQVSYAGVHFNHDLSLASTIRPLTIEGQNLGEDYHPEATYPEHIRFEFEQYLVADHFFTPFIRVYPVSDYQAISETAVSTIQNLQTTLREQPGGGMFSSLPSLPLWGAVQIFTTQVQYINFQNGSGLRYLSMFGQDMSPPDNRNLVYIYQGITNDQAYYISAVLPITHPLLPDDGYESITDWDAFFDGWEDHLQTTIQDLEQADPLSFFPSILLLDEMMTSFWVD
jgi:hypothetical protein